MKIGLYSLIVRDEWVGFDFKILNGTELDVPCVFKWRLLLGLFEIRRHI